MTAPYGSSKFVKDLDVHTVDAASSFRLPLVHLVLSPQNLHPAKGLMIFNTNTAINSPGCSAIWYADGTAWRELELCQVQTPLPQ